MSIFGAEMRSRRGSGLGASLQHRQVLSMVGRGIKSLAISLIHQNWKEGEMAPILVDYLLYEPEDNGILWIKFNRPERMNALVGNSQENGTGAKGG